MSILELKKAYNILIAREKKAEKYLDNWDIPQSKKDGWLPEFAKITECLSMLMADYKKLTGEEISNDNVLNGFQ